MGWVKDALHALETTGECLIRPQGGSMRGRIESGQEVRLVRIAPEDVRVDDAVLVRWKGNYLLHLIKEVRDEEVLIGNNLAKINGWVKRTNVIARVVE